MSTAFSAIITAGAWVLPRPSIGMTEQSMTRRPPHARARAAARRRPPADRCPSCRCPMGERSSRRCCGKLQQRGVIDGLRAGFDLALARMAASVPIARLRAPPACRPPSCGDRVLRSGNSAASTAAPSDRAMRIAMCPRDAGRSWQVDSVKPENGCTLPPAMSADSVATWNWMSGVAASAGSARMKQPPWLMPTASGPRAREAATAGRS